MREEEQRKAFEQAVNRRLSFLTEDPFLAKKVMEADKGENIVVKKKLSVSLVLALVLMLATMSAALALVSSRIAGEIFGSQENAPEEILQQIQTPQATQATSLGAVSVDELLYDGVNLHLALTVKNPTQETLLYTIDSLRLDGKRLVANHLLSEGAGTAGMLLGGSVEGVALPESYSFYLRGRECVLTDEKGKYLGLDGIPEGEATLTVSLAVWKPVNAPQLVDYRQYEGVDVNADAAKQASLITDDTGYCHLELLRPSRYNLNVTSAQLPSAVYADAYGTLGWAKLTDTVTLEMTVDLSKHAIVRAVPTQTVYAMGECQLVIDSFEMSHAGGQMRGRVTGAEAAVWSLMKNGLILADRDNQRILSVGCYWDDLSDEGMRFTLNIGAVSGEMPGQVWLAPVIAYDGRWDASLPCYDPSLEKPEGVIGEVQMDFARAACLMLDKTE